ncbi:alpha-L-fucosidase [Diaminobutyricimonas aerilata]|uniref:alpha-L-fucosidase n=1 Tax=Diaminobutyricimonas aerilata TaxID=1162967 RepID=A0A2M9CN54_9MICO|nr:alpha-L-fucosidase [Diaminobutyricimonas aerilata]PJJ73337.1 alpha-L-fucosidase [Diaminobutyricimonas aerilata]
MFKDDPVRPANYERFARDVPQWYTDAKLGIFVHWGPYSVPAWGEPIGELGTIDPEYWFAHNPYAEWYYNTIRIAGSPAAEHHEATYGGAPYDTFIDQWTAAEFDADEFIALVKRTGARYFVPTTKHHDGVTLWDAPATGDRNTVARGPRRDLVGEFAEATRRAGLRFGVYYSGGLDWHFGDLPPITDEGQAFRRPVDDEYARYAHDHVSDLIRRYSPDILWGDIEWPDAGKPSGPHSMEHLFEEFYAAAPDGVANDRWGETHWDFRTSEYQNGTSVEGSGAWENCRGIGYSFGYNRLEGPEHILSGPEAVKTFVDIVSRGGNLLLNVGLTAEGRVPDLQRETLEFLATWNAENGHAVFGSRPFDAAASAEPWTRWTQSDGRAHAFVVGSGAVTLAGVSDAVDATTARAADGSSVAATRAGDRVEVQLPRGGDAPVLVSFDLAGPIA